MKKKFVTFVFLFGLVAVLALLPDVARAENCAGQVVIYNNSSYVVQMIAINNPWEHLDVPAGATYLGHIPYNQPQGFAKDVPGVGEIKLFKLQVDSQCDFGGDAQVWVNNNTAWYALPQGFSTAW